MLGFLLCNALPGCHSRGIYINILPFPAFNKKNCCNGHLKVALGCFYRVQWMQSDIDNGLFHTMCTAAVFCQ